MSDLMNSVIHSDKQCEHLCLIGIRVYSEDESCGVWFPIYDGNIVAEHKQQIIEVFNTCPRCGQDLNVGIEDHKTFLKFMAVK